MNQEKACQNCKQNFLIEQEDFDFYNKIKVPPPTFCPDCRLQRRMLFRNERTLYKRENNAPDHTGEQIFSIHRPDAPVTVYDDRTWWSDKWDPMDYGQEYDFSRPFFEQYKELYRRTPVINLSITNLVNCQYCNVSEGDKGSYMLSGSEFNEDTLYGNRVVGNKQSMDMYVALRNELCYELVNSTSNYRVFNSINTHECADSNFLFNCRNCTDCIGCVNLRNKSYCILNEQYSREEYLKRKAELKLETREGVEKMDSLHKDLMLHSIHRYANIIKSVNATGDNLESVKNGKNCFDIFEAEDVKFCSWGGYGLKDSYDAAPGVGIKAEMLYDCVDTGLQESYCFWTSVVYHCYNVRYSINCHSSSNLFGCYGLRSKEYCIFNKQYTKEEYEALLPRIIEHMNAMPYIDSKGRIFTYGEFFPYDISPFAYNETIAQEYFPLSKEQSIEHGFIWQDKISREYQPTVESENLPKSILDTDDSIINEIIRCKSNSDPKKQCTGAYRINVQELEMLRKLNIPLPKYCFSCRHFNRISMRNPLKLWHRSCMCSQESHGHPGKCMNEFETSYSPERTEQIYCESCYQKEVL